MTPAMHERPSVPKAAWVIAVFVFLAMFLGLSIMATRGAAPFPWALFMFIPALFMAGYVVLVGYVYADAKHRGMRYVMWTWLAILVPNGIGVILYFLLREPVPVYCSRCGAPTRQGFAFCPSCGAGTAPACPQCHKVCQPGWSHCPYCGVALASGV